MKKLILSVVVMAFAVAVQAGEGKACKDKAACNDKNKSACQAKGDKSACSATPTKKALLSPKAASERGV